MIDLAVEVVDGVYWVGAIDWNVRDFHGYELDIGTTYNAYLVVGEEKVALVDLVKHGFFWELREKVEEIVPFRKIDYIVVNHIEPDHASSLPEAVRELGGDVEILVSKRGESGLRKYYGCEDCRIRAVKTGDKLELGGKTLRFIEAPMIHWPDSMFTYLDEKALLMPNDAFGQHVATSERFDDQVDLEWLVDRAAEYYANIVLPYSDIVLRKLDELRNLRIEIIAPSHGIIWRKNVGRIVEEYRRWASGESDPRVAVIYDSMWGSTELMAKAVLRGLIDSGVQAGLFHLRKTPHARIMKEVMLSKGIAIGIPTLNKEIFPTVAGFLTYIKGLSPKRKYAALFGSYGWGEAGVKKTAEILAGMDFEIIGEAVTVKFRPSEDELRLCYELGKALAERILED